jgi:glycerol-3-phosphate acyltransferase PlsX
MGSVFAEEIVGSASPTVALLSIGEEPEKGNRLVREAHGELVTAQGIDFVGNVESRDLLRKAADVVVCDGFTGNMALKLLEGTIKTTLDTFREEVTASLRGKLGGLLIRPAARALRTRLDPDTYGGAYLLGLGGLVVIAHGNSSRTAVANAIRYAALGVRGGVVQRVADRLATRVGATPAA